MRVGSDNSKKTIIAGVLFVIAIIMVVRMLAGNAATPVVAGATSSPALPTLESARPVHREGTHTPRRVAKQDTTVTATASLDPRLRLDLLKETETMEYTGKGRNIFLAQETDVVQIPQPKAPVLLKEAEKGPPPPPPKPYVAPPPPIELKFFGFANSAGSKKVFLSHGDDVFVAAEGDIVNRRYKIVKINANNVEILDVLNNNHQTIPLSAG